MLPFGLDYLRDRPGLVIGAPTLETAMAYVRGIDAACAHGFLSGFREWLVLRVDDGDNLAWDGLVQIAILPHSKDPRVDAEDTLNQRPLIAAFMACLEEFLEERNKPEGLLGIFLRYQAWRDRRAAEIDAELALLDLEDESEDPMNKTHE